MKIFSIRNLIGIGAIYGLVQYSKKHGGMRNAFEGLIDKVKSAANQREQVIGSQQRGEVGSQSVGQGVGSTSSGKEQSGYGSTSGSYSGGGYSSGYGGGDDTNRRR